MADRDYTPVDVSQNILDRFRMLPVATIWGHTQRDAGVPLPFMEGVYPFTKKRRLAARARTLRYLPPRPDIVEETKLGEDGPEYRAMGRCGPGDVLVCDLMKSTRPCVFGDVKAIQLKMNGADGIVTDGGIRDVDIMEEEEYGLVIYAGARTPYGGGPWAVPAEENVQIQCAGILVRPGDVLVGDGDGVVVVPSWFAEECVHIVEEHEGVETYIKERIQAEGCAPGKYYPPTPEMWVEYRSKQK